MKTLLKIFVCCALAGFGLHSKAVDNNEREVLEAEMAAAQAELERAAERIAELSRAMTEGEVMTVVSRMHNSKRKALLGVRIDDIDIASEGVLIESVSSDGPAATAGVKKGDLVTAINGRSVIGDKGVGVLLEILTELTPGDIARLELNRDGQSITKDVETASYADAFPDQHTHKMKPFVLDESQIEQWVEKFKGIELMSDADIDIDLSVEDMEALSELPQKLEKSLSGINVGPVIAMLGGRNFGLPNFELAEVSSELGTYFGVDNGVLVTQTPSSGEATKMTEIDLRAGDVILSIDGKPMRAVGDVHAAFSNAEPDTTMDVVLVRQRETVNVAVRVPDPFSGDNWTCERSADGKQRKCVKGDDNMFSFSFSTDDEE